MARLDVKSLTNNPDETRRFAGHGELKMSRVSGIPIGLGRFEPGWKWSNDVKPIAGTESCQAEHVGYCMSGRMRVRMDDGSEQEVGPGDSMYIPPGHDAWVVGDEPCTMIDFMGAEHYAERRAASGRQAGMGAERPSVH